QKLEAIDFAFDQSFPGKPVRKLITLFQMVVKIPGIALIALRTPFTRLFAALTAKFFAVLNPLTMAFLKFVTIVAILPGSEVKKFTTPFTSPVARLIAVFLAFVNHCTIALYA